MNQSRRIFLFRDLPSQGIEKHLILIGQDTPVLKQLSIDTIIVKPVIESYRFGNDFIVTETDYQLTPKQVIELRKKVGLFNAD